MCPVTPIELFSWQTVNERRAVRADAQMLFTTHHSFIHSLSEKEFNEVVNV